MAVFSFAVQTNETEYRMPRTDDLRIREMKELTPPSHLIREFPVTPAAEETASAARVAPVSYTHLTLPTILLV